LNLPEIEREEILADRAEERQKHLDSLALGELYKATRGDEAEDEPEETTQQAAPEPAADEDDESEAMDLVDSDEDAEGEPENETEDLGQRRESVSLLDCCYCDGERMFCFRCCETGAQEPCDGGLERETKAASG
jgi:hypothetical protein